ncbi:MAG: hypothetical protein PSX81_15125 [bacterium]|nr:hypothetical protein [bacterium]
MSIQVAKVRNFSGHSQAVYTLCKGEDTNVFYSSGADGMVVKWNLEQADGQLLIRFPYPIYSLCRFKDNLLCGGNKGVLTVFNLTTKKIVNQLQFDTSAIFDILVWYDKFLLANGNGILIVLTKDFVIEKQSNLSNKSLRKMVATETTVFVAGSEGIIWQLDKLANIVKFQTAHDQSIFALDYDFENNILISGGRDAVLKVWDNLEVLKIISAHWYHINCISFNETQTYFATCSLDKSIKLWKSENHELLKVISNEKYEAHQSSVNKILWIGINRFISCSDDRMIMCFEIQQK